VLGYRRLEIFRKVSEQVYLSNVEVRKQLTVPFLRYLIAKLGKMHWLLWEFGKIPDNQLNID